MDEKEDEFAETGKLVDPASHYHDFSKSDPNPLEKEGAQNFPMKLHMILSNPDFQDIIAWLPHGRSWRILQHKAFEERVIPLYFRHGRYSSFARQVNGWSFKRITCGPDYNSYYHEMFLRGKPHLCRKMKRVASKDGKDVDHDPDAPVPDFYAISRDYPLPELTGFRSRDEAAGSSGYRQDMGGISYPNSREQDIAALERRRLELLQRFSALPSGSATSGTADPNLASLLMLISMQQQQQQQQLGSTLATLAAGINQGSLAGANALGWPQLGLSSLAQMQSTPLAQLLAQYQQTGTGGATLTGPAPSLAPPTGNLADLFSQNAMRQNPLSQAGLLPSSASGLPGLSALLGTNTMVPAGAGSVNSNLLLQNILSSASGLNGASNGTDLAALLQSQPQTTSSAAESPAAERKASDDLVSASTADSTQRQLLSRAPAPAALASMTSASLGAPDLQQAGAALSPALLAYLQKQVNPSSGAPATSGQDVTSLAASSVNGVAAPSLPNNILSLFALNHSSSAAPSQATSQPIAPIPQDELQRQLLNALEASSSANANLPGSSAPTMSRDLQQLLQQQLQTQLNGLSGLNNGHAPSSSQGSEGDES